MHMHHTLDCAKFRLNPESHWLVNGSFLLTESFCKNYLFRVTSLWCIFVNPCLVVHPTHMLVHHRVHRAHRLKSATLKCTCQRWSLSGLPVGYPADSEFATRYGYPKTAIKQEPDTDPDIRNAFFDISRIQIFGRSCTLHNHSFLIINHKHLFSPLCHDSESACGVITVP